MGGLVFNYEGIERGLILLNEVVLLGVGAYRGWRNIRARRGVWWILGSVVLTVVMMGVWPVVGMLTMEVVGSFFPFPLRRFEVVWLPIWALFGGVVGMTDLGVLLAVGNGVVWGVSGAAVGGTVGIVLGGVFGLLSSAEVEEAMYVMGGTLLIFCGVMGVVMGTLIGAWAGVLQWVAGEALKRLGGGKRA